ncbi:hypothetical protein BD560DRAFT_402780 [Blakeslea trispora]|nr:hypothetical protein BD560DRAFT_402780 [Blakeslea trispora]
MNRLGFGEFHQKHFSPKQQQYWHAMLFEQAHQVHDDTYYTDYGQETWEEEQIDQQASEELVEDYSDQILSKEAIEILNFSEAYRKEREQERLRMDDLETKGMEGWQYGESSVLVSGGIEAPATSLVLTRPHPTEGSELKMKEDMLNSAYLASCSSQGDDIVLWPVVPLRL